MARAKGARSAAARAAGASGSRSNASSASSAATAAGSFVSVTSISHKNTAEASAIPLEAMLTGRFIHVAYSLLGLLGKPTAAKNLLLFFHLLLRIIVNSWKVGVALLIALYSPEAMRPWRVRDRVVAPGSREGLIELAFVFLMLCAITLLSEGWLVYTTRAAEGWRVVSSAGLRRRIQLERLSESSDPLVVKVVVGFSLLGLVVSEVWLVYSSGQFSFPGGVAVFVVLQLFSGMYTMLNGPLAAVPSVPPRLVHERAEAVKRAIETEKLSAKQVAVLVHAFTVDFGHFSENFGHIYAWSSVGTRL